MNPLFAAGLEFQHFMQKRGWAFCFIGGLAVLRWGEIRMTQDVDLCLLTGFGDEEPYIRDLVAAFQSRIPEAAALAAENRALLLKASNAVAADISLGALPFEKRMVERASAFKFAPGCPLLTCSAEDLVVLKAFADRERDRADVNGIIMRQHRRLDRDYILEQLEPLCAAKNRRDIVERLKRLLEV